VPYCRRLARAQTPAQTAGGALLYLQAIPKPIKDTSCCEAKHLVFFNYLKPFFAQVKKGGFVLMYCLYSQIIFLSSFLPQNLS
jgi:hypothetical protein